MVREHQIYLEYISLISYLGSMEPTLNVNDVIVVKSCDVRELKNGDIITFTKDKRTISHRIIKIMEKERDRAFVTQGDRNEIADEGFISKEQIYGKVIFNIPKIGNVVEYIQNKKGFIQIIILVIIAFLLTCMKDERKNRRKQIRKKYEIKKERDKYN